MQWQAAPIFASGEHERVPGFELRQPSAIVFGRCVQDAREQRPIGRHEHDPEGNCDGRGNCRQRSSSRARRTCP